MNTNAKVLIALPIIIGTIAYAQVLFERKLSRKHHEFAKKYGFAYIRGFKPVKKYQEIMKGTAGLTSGLLSLFLSGNWHGCKFHSFLLTDRHNRRQTVVCVYLNRDYYPPFSINTSTHANSLYNRFNLDRKARKPFTPINNSNAPQLKEYCLTTYASCPDGIEIPEPLLSELLQHQGFNFELLGGMFFLYNPSIAIIDNPSPLIDIIGIARRLSEALKSAQLHASAADQ